MNNLSKNFVLCGEVEYHCLLCVETFYKIDDVDKHIRWEQHRKILKEQSFFPKMRRDCIYKIGAQFYCEICNMISPDVSDITAHIKGVLHVTNKGNPNEGKEKLNCKRDSGFVIVSDIILAKEEWNTIVNKQCLLCDKPVTCIADLEIHSKTSEHVINLIQAKVVRESEDKLYRKINPNTVYCLICKMPVSTQTLSDHWENEGHIRNKERSISRTTKGTGAVKNKQKEYLYKLMEIQKVLYDIDVKGGKATCKYCKKVLKFNFSEMLSHQEEHAKAHSPGAKRAEEGNDTSEDEEVVFSEVTDHGKKRAELKQYGKKHNIKLNEGGSRGYCYTCHTQLSAHIQVFRQHVRGWLHRGHLEYQGLKKETKREQRVYKTEPLKDYLKIAFYSHSYEILWLNSMFGVENSSFLFVAPINDRTPPKKYVCYVCKVEYNKEDNEKHLKTAQHKANFIEAEVVTSLDGEFIREIAPNLYHCGFCNRPIAYYDNVLRHFRNWGHQDTRVSKHIHSDMSKKCCNESGMAVFSTNPDVLYLQLMQRVAFNRSSKSSKSV